MIAFKNNWQNSPAIKNLSSKTGEELRYFLKRVDQYYNSDLKNDKEGVIANNYSLKYAQESVRDRGGDASYYLTPDKVKGNIDTLTANQEIHTDYDQIKNKESLNKIKASLDTITTLKADKTQLDQEKKNNINGLNVENKKLTTERNGLKSQLKSIKDEMKLSEADKNKLVLQFSTLMGEERERVKHKLTSFYQDADISQDDIKKKYESNEDWKKTYGEDIKVFDYEDIIDEELTFENRGDMEKAFKVVVFICAAEKFKNLSKLNEKITPKPLRVQTAFNNAEKVWEEIAEYQQIGKENNYFYLNVIEERQKLKGEIEELQNLQLQPPNDTSDSDIKKDLRSQSIEGLINDFDNDYKADQIAWAVELCKNFYLTKLPQYIEENLQSKNPALTLNDFDKEMLGGSVLELNDLIDKTQKATIDKLIKAKEKAKKESSDEDLVITETDIDNNNQELDPTKLPPNFKEKVKQMLRKKRRELTPEPTTIQGKIKELLAKIDKIMPLVEKALKSDTLVGYKLLDEEWLALKNKELDEKNENYNSKFDYFGV
nr:5737_t:CDS:2 [Entrophospora candida]